MRKTSKIRWTKKKINILCGICITVSSFTYYFLGHKDYPTLFWLLSGIIVIGWLIIIIANYYHLYNERKISFKRRTDAWIAQKIKNGAIVILPAIAIVSNLILLEQFVNSRIEDVLENKPTKECYAKVVRLENRHTGRHRKEYAIIEYKTSKEKIQQAMDNFSKKYETGQTLLVKYSVEYPDMFIMEKIIELKPEIVDTNSQRKTEGNVFILPRQQSATQHDD